MNFFFDADQFGCNRYIYIYGSRLMIVIFFAQNKR